MTEQDRPFSVQVERSIAERAAGGDSSAVAELYDAYERQLYGYCQRICRNPEDAADATQDAFCSVIQRLPGLDTANLNFAAYLFTTARNACMDIVKQRGRAEPTDEVPEDPFATAAIDTDPERLLLTGDQQRAAREASDRLPESQRTVLALREVSELSYDEIAKAMGMKPNAVAQLISRARLNFYKQLRSGAVVVAPLDAAAQRAIELTVKRQDGKINSDDLDWLQAHLSENESSRLNAEAIQESAVLYRAIAPAVVLAGLRTETLQRAIDAINAGPGADAPSGDGGAGVGGASSGAAIGARPVRASTDNRSLAEAGERRRDQRRAGVALGVLILIVLIAGSLDTSEVSTAADAGPVAAPTQETTTARSAEEPRNSAKAKAGPRDDAVKTPTTSQNSQGGTEQSVKSGGTPRSGDKNSSRGEKTTSGGQSENPPASDPAPQTTNPPASDPAPDPN
ncbi:MAG: sigma-70 family RNA polymerase sigma factor, partial [Thermoleophilaceae bacterium]|nr:sigma-70 family RNA polymerase sigma factor [Thermoleophilaceae bacterium]